MMASSTVNGDCTEQATAASPTFNYICAPIEGEAQKKIIRIIDTLPHQLSHQHGESVLVLFWAPKEIGDASVLTTTHMPFRLYGNNKELHEYNSACSDHKLYVYRGAKGEAAFGLAGMAYLSCKPQQTQDVHEYPDDDQRPPCDATIFTKKWGAFAVPVIEANKCVVVLEFIMDTPRDYKNDIDVVQKLLEHAGFQTSIQIDRTKRTYLGPKKMIRKSKSFDKTKYCHLVPLFGLSSARAAEILGFNKSTFRNVCRRVGIPEWPYIRITTARDSASPNADLISISDEYLAFMDDEQESMKVIENLTAYLSDKEFPKWAQQTITTNSDPLLPERVGPASMADFDEMNILDDGKWINDMFAACNYIK